METLLTPSRVQVSVNSTWQAETTGLPPRPDGICKRNFLHPPVPQWQRIGEMDEIRALILSVSFAPRGIEDHACFDGWL